MISQLSPAFARVSVQVKPEDLFLKKGSWVQFSKEWPSDHEWASGKFFTVSNDPLVVTFPMSWTIPGNDYIDVNLANLPSGFTTQVLNLYPAKGKVLYQAAIGIKKGDFFIQVGIPAAQQYVYRLGQSFMYPNLADANLRYLGQKTYKDSPEDAPLLSFYFIYNLAYFFLRVFALEGKDFEKCGVVFYINKLDLQQVSPTPEMQQKATLIPYFTELVAD